MNNLLEVRGLCKTYGSGPNRLEVLSGIDLDLQAGTTTALIGASGAGKSTLLNILGGMDQATSGVYSVDSRDVAKFNPKELSKFRRDQVGFVFQFYNLMGNLTALENIELASSVVPDPLDPGELLKDVGLEKRGGNFPSQLSGGEQQRVAIARAIVKNPKLLLGDEPTGALDSKTGASIHKLLYEVSHNYKKTVVIVTHNSKIADCAERLIRISDGKIIADALAKSPQKPEEIVW